ncbi:acyltransferase family protein [Elizabethkingia meningoseptica]|uniref:acyltransferase family protein n=1 Tax=Elizabethkingia meningoseptica TaxID=238 RepID=UPI0016262D5C|nr:acyltransferase [Elizabethkingia meningoseptica]MBG0514105.1 acyltransferase [Elizabethkingia meningoseptica]MDE5433021.1 acyltransferase [Elizabethkingia meningoseptica]
MNEIKSLTGLRGIAAIWVVFFHFFSFITQLLSDRFGLIFIPLNNIVKKGYLSVDLFFFLSALVLTMSYQSKFNLSVDSNNFKNYIKKRFARIYPLYLFVILISFILQENLTISHVITHLTLTEVFFNTYINTVVYPIWSLSVEFLVYLIFPFLLLLINKMSFIVKIIILVISLYVTFLVQYIPSPYFDLNSLSWIFYPSNGLLDINIGLLAFVRGLCVYIVGSIVYPYLKRINKYILISSSILLLTFLSVGANDFLVYLLLLTIPSACITIKSLNRILSNKLFHYLGKVSYSIYLNHILILTICNYIFSEKVFIVRIIAFILTITVSILTFEFIEKPGKKYLLNMKAFNKILSQN